MVPEPDDFDRYSSNLGLSSSELISRTIKCLTMFLPSKHFRFHFFFGMILKKITSKIYSFHQFHVYKTSSQMELRTFPLSFNEELGVEEFEKIIARECDPFARFWSGPLTQNTDTVLKIRILYSKNTLKVLFGLRDNTKVPENLQRVGYLQY